MHINNHLSSFLTKKQPHTIEVVLILFIALLIPLLAISFFTHPSADEYSMAAKIHDLGFWTTQLRSYEEWSGRYLCNFALGLNPLVYHNFFMFKLVPIAFFVSFIGSLYFLVRTAFPEWIPRESLALTAGICIVYFSGMPQLHEGFYWLSGAVTYQIGNILALLFLAFWIKMYEKQTYTYFLCALLCLIGVIGSNETSLLFVMFFLTAAIVAEGIEKKRIRIQPFLLFIGSIGFSLVALLAPGNKMRGMQYPKAGDLFFSVAYSVINTVKMLVAWLPEMLVLSIIFYELLLRIKVSNKVRIFSYNPLITSGLLILFPFLGSFPYAWSTGLPPIPRVSNVSMLFVLLGVILLVINLIYHFREKLIPPVRIPSFVRYTVVLVFIGLVFRTENIRSLYFDLFSGRALAYDAQMNQRYAHILTAVPGDTIVLPPLIRIPSTIAYGDIGTDPGYWKNVRMMDYFNSGPIRLGDR